jgi:copper resistance protein B
MIAWCLAVALAGDDLLPPPGGYEQPMLRMSAPVYGQLLVDRMEGHVGGDALHGVVDAEGWWGPDRTRLRYRLEAEGEPTGPEGEGDAAVLVGRLFAPFWEVQGGAMASGRVADGAKGEGSVFVGVEGAVPYDVELELTLGVSHTGRVHGAVELEKDLLFGQRTVLQWRGEVAASSRASEALGTAAGLTTAQAGLRLRHEVHRQFAPYVGGDLGWVSAGGPLHVGGVGGIRWWL